MSLATTATNSKKKVILIVDDEADMRELLGMRFRKKGVEVLEADSAGSALQTLQSVGKVDCVVSDVKMPNGDGFYLLDEIKKRDVFLPFVFFTGFSNIDESEAYRLGAEGILNKSLSMAEMADYVLNRLEFFSKSLAVPPSLTGDQGQVEAAFLTLDIARENSLFELGRGGFALRLATQSDDFKQKAYINFTIQFESGPIKRLKGIGLIVSKYPSKEGGFTNIGVELCQLEEGDRGAFLLWKNQIQPRAFIPKFL